MHEQIKLNDRQTGSTDLFRLLVESVYDYAIFHLDPQGYVQSWNEGARRIKGYEASEIIGQHFSIFYLPQEARRGKPAYELAVATDEGRWEEEGWRLRKDGTRFWANVVITALFDPTGQLVGFAKVTRDLTDRKHAEEVRDLLLERERQARGAAEEALDELQTLQSLTETALTHLSFEDVIDELLDRLQSFLEVDTAVLLLLDPESNILIPIAMKGINTPIENMMHFPIGQGFAGRVASERRSITINDLSQEQILDPALREIGICAWMGVPLLAESEVIGVLHVGSFYHRNFGDKDERILEIVADRVAMAIDRTRLIEAEQEARIEAETTAAKLRAQESFLAVAAHELRSPTAAVKTAVQLLTRRLAARANDDQQAWLPFLETAEQQADRLTRLVEKLIESVRIDAGQLVLEPVHTNVAALVRQVVELSRTAGKHQKIAVSGPVDLWAWVDTVRFDEVVSNLLENAITYSPAGTKIEVDLDQSGDDVLRLSIRDYGPGIPPEFRPSLFKRFSHGPDGTVKRGLGLGLYICHDIVAGHGGEIHADFPEDGGTRFTVTLPTQAKQ